MLTDLGPLGRRDVGGGRRLGRAGAGLLPRDGQRFVTEYEAALDEARQSLDLGTVLEVVERWRQIAVLQTDPGAYRRTMRLAAELATGETSPEGEPLDVTSAKAEM